MCSSQTPPRTPKWPCPFVVHHSFCAEALLSDVYTVPCAHSQSVMSYTLRPTDCDPTGFSVPGMFQARILAWTAFSYSGGSSKAEIDLLHLLHLHWQAGSLSPMPAGKHKLYYSYFFFHYVACALGIIKLHFRHTEFEMPM